LYKILFIAILLGFIISLAGCNWLSLGLLNVFDPQAQIRVNYTEINLEEGTINLEIYSINEVEFIGSGFEYDYYIGTTKIPELSKTVGATFYVAPSTSPGSPGAITTINLDLYYQEVQDYLYSNPLITEITCTINLIGTDGAGHDITKSVTFDLPALEPGIDFTPPTAFINVTPGTTGTAPFTVVFDASESYDNEPGDALIRIESYNWDFGDGTSATEVMPAAHTYTSCGSYIVKLTVTDFWGNEGYATEIITVGETGGPNVDIQVTPGTTGTAPFTVYFDASDTTFETECGVGTATYSWNFGDGSSETGVTTSHTYTSNGVYTVILTVTDAAGNIGYGSVIITVGVAGEVNAVIKTTPDPPTGTAPFTVGLDASESTTSVSDAKIVKYTWDFDDGSTEVYSGTPLIPVTTHIYYDVGTYLVQLTVEDSAGNIGYKFVSIVVTYPEEPEE
jgi:PKD repeat protein